MRTAGVDLASQNKKTAACVIDWSDRGATVVELSTGVDDDLILRLLGEVDKLGIDVPLGWPIAFAQAMGRHSMDHTWPTDYRHATNEGYRLRRTDLKVRDELKMSPLSVSADRIAIPAMRAAAVLSRVPHAVARDGSGVVVEVYPAAALSRWGLRSRKYKHKENADHRRELVGGVLISAPWLSIDGDFVDLCSGSDDALDAVVAALVARAAALGFVDEIPPEELTSARREGWIALPIEGSLSRLVVG
ncbi:MAG: DUF429 domain-containing protein [Actinomycetota bacterium]|jgi:predicted nuclease with RNAse H fold|nr:DUF429 domain-containing protein [Actinomycetota bacterium]